MKITKYVINTNKILTDLRLAVVSDLHARPYQKVLDALNRIQPDLILLPGDILEVAAKHMEKRNENGLRFLEKATEIAPVYYCYGNHEIYHSHENSEGKKVPDPALAAQYEDKIRSFGVKIVNDRSVALHYGGTLHVGGLVCGREMDPALPQNGPDLAFLKKFDQNGGFKILLCHYPHYFKQYLKDTDADLILSGHAHGGQWRIFGRGVYAPHQGLFPQYTSGLHDGRHIISRGCVNNAKPIPRLFNPCEVLEIRIVGEKE